MGIAALILGIISIIIGFIPLCGSIAFVPALVGLILGIVDTVKKSKNGEKKGVSIAGIVLSALAIIIISVYIFIFGKAVSQIDPEEWESALKSSFEDANITFTYSDYE